MKKRFVFLMTVLATCLISVSCDASSIKGDREFEVERTEKLLSDWGRMNMNNAPMNFTGKCKLTDAEFAQNYDQLWEKTPHKNNWPSKQEIAEKKQEGAKRYNAEEAILPGEEWRDLPGYDRYSISTMGRVKYNGIIVQQDDAAKTGYLKLDVDKKLSVDHSVNVYTLVAKTFLGKKEGDGYDVHHIDNNGYDNRPENLILLTRPQHNAVHSDEKLSQEALKSLLEQATL
ncbi:MAG: hypothetical protein HDR32_05670 [Treponema sp.]|nr:hypothetical protein [Treponema sp.]